MAKDPTVQQMRAFQAVATELHFGRAAARLHSTQPPLTRHIQALESSLGIQLLRRNSRNVELTPAGRTFLAEIDIVMARLERAMEMAKSTAGGVLGQLSLGYVEPMALGLLPRVLHQFVLLHPGLELRLHEMDTRDQIAGLHDGGIDCGLLRAPGNVDPWLEFENVCTDVFVAALPPSHRLVRDGRSEIDLAELADEPFIAHEGSIGQGMINAMLSGCAAAGFTPAVRHLVQNTLMLLALVAAGEGVALVSGEIARRPSHGVRFVRLQGDPAQSSILMASRRGERNQARDDLVHLLRRAAPVMPAAADTDQ
ncbi:LysR family transcriptional regulator [Actinomadura madurae]|uniref:LysR family transcriptional regulator n=1 Tax=Actinomadura madurae TaxID=1993 RepID=UPI000D8EB27A|nr:LysR family transcriptional regulator [Actinomadura madurae]SPT60235.1 Ben and cat operon transcriptional regulator [Actinomadura madurae]